MKQVNFKELNVEIEIDTFQTIDFRKEIGNKLHQQAVTIPMDELARKIYHSEGFVDIQDEEYAMMMSIISKSFSLVISQAVDRCTKKEVAESCDLRSKELDKSKDKEE